MLRENNEDFLRRGKGVIPITGFSCWALGYLDKKHKLVGCLLHPASNGGNDLRYRVDFGEKCRRETCPEAKIFSNLGVQAKEFWLHMADGLDSFSYAGRTTNPLFDMMDWGKDLLEQIAMTDVGIIYSWKSFLESYPFFLTNLSPRANAYLLRRLITRRTLHILKDPHFRSAFEKFSGRMTGLLGRKLSNSPSAPHVHLLDSEQDFLNFLRLSACIYKAGAEDVSRLKKITDEQLQKFREKFL